jgi:deoxyinosine 3'endonuclease (endonuclease V)
MTGIEDWNILVNEEFLVSVVHHTTLITSLPFVHTARRSYRWDEEMNLADRAARQGKPVKSLRL